MFNPNCGVLSTLLMDDGSGSKEQTNELFSKPSEITLHIKNQTEKSGRASPFFFVNQLPNEHNEWLCMALLAPC